MQRLKIAVIGGGVSGLVSAWLLGRAHEVVLMEAGARLGGHARTVQVATAEGAVDVDTGFIVCNDKTYPLFVPLMAHLGVALAPSDMSFSASFGGGTYEYGTTRPLDLFAQRARLLDPSHWRMIRDCLRFFKEGPRHQAAAGTIGALLTALGLGAEFKDRFLMPISGAIWSTPTQAMEAFPAATFLRFFENHGLLSVASHPQWRTVQGGSQAYVQALAAAMKAQIRLNAGVRALRREGGQVVVASAQGEERFDRVVLATHAPQALALLAAGGGLQPREQAILGAIRTAPNRMVLHSDPRLMPKNRRAWSSWNMVTKAQAGPSRAPMSLSYWMNRLQPLPTKQPLIVTLNPEFEPAHAHDEALFHHPQFDAAAIAAQGLLPEIQGAGGVYFAGAWTRYGFHEDGVLSGLRVAQALGVDWPLGRDPWPEHARLPLDPALRMVAAQ